MMTKRRLVTWFVLLVFWGSTTCYSQSQSEAAQAIDDASGALSTAEAEWDALDLAVDDLVDAIWEAMAVHGVNPGGQIEQDMDTAGNVRQAAQDTLDDMTPVMQTVADTIDDGITNNQADAVDWYNAGSYTAAFNLASSAIGSLGSIYNALAETHAVVAYWTERMWEWAYMGDSQ